MLPAYTPAVEHALRAASTWAARLGAAEVQPAHLLLGLIEEEEGRAAGLLSRAGLTSPALRQHLTRGQHGVQTNDSPAAGIPLPHSPASRQVLACAADLAH